MTAKEREYKKQYRKTHREAINAYRRQWYRKNAEKQKEYNIRYWEKKNSTTEGGNGTSDNKPS